MIMNLCLVFVLFGVGLALPTEFSLQQEWVNFKTRNQKSYDSPEEEARRFQIFQDNLRKIDEHNEKYARGESTFTMDINQFADMSFEEFKNSGRVGGLKDSKNKFGKPKLGASQRSALSYLAKQVLDQQYPVLSTQWNTYSQTLPQQQAPFRLGARFGGDPAQSSQWRTATAPQSTY